MKKRILKLIKNEGGQALVLVIALLGVGSIMLAPLLSFMGTGLVTGRVYEAKEREIYAADSGVEDAIWKIHNDGEGLVDTTTAAEWGIVLEGLPLYYVDHDSNPSTDPIVYDTGVYDIADVNGKSLRIRIQYLDEMTYRVVSNAPNDGSGTVIDAFVTTVYGDYTGITDHVITSPSGYDIDQGVVYPDGDYDPDTNPNGARGDYDGPWPAPIELMNYYSMFVDKGNPYDYEEIDLNDVATHDEDFIGYDGEIVTIDSAYIEGDFSIESSKKDVELRLEGNLYITGRTNFGGAKEWKIDLNGNSIFIESDATGGGADGTALSIESKVTLTSSGCLIAVGDIDFQPHMDANPFDYILVLSVIGETRMLPNGSFYGTLAGQVFVDVKSGSDPYIQWNDPDTDGDGIPDIDFPGGSSATVVYGLLSWKIS